MPQYVLDNPSLGALAATAIGASVGFVLIFPCRFVWWFVFNLLFKPRGGIKAVLFGNLSTQTIVWLIFVSLTLTYSTIAISFIFYKEIHRNDPLLPEAIPEQILSAFDEINEPALGPFIGTFELDQFAYATHDHAVILWGAFPKLYHIFIKTDADKSYVKYRIDATPVSNKDYFKDDYMRKLLHLKNGDCPPLGGLGELWRTNREESQWIGFRKNQYSYGNRKIFVQKFDRGMKIGPIPIADGDIRAAIMVVPDPDNAFKFASVLSKSLSAPIPDWSAPKC